MLGFWIIVALIAAAWHFLPVLVAIAALLVFLGLAVLALGELFDWITGEDREGR